jgi:NitT/TauT family transport system substrate-binding protein
MTKSVAAAATARCIMGVVLAIACAVGAMRAHAAEPLKIGYSDWPGWVAWQVAIDKGWFKEAGVAVDFEWFDY